MAILTPLMQVHISWDGKSQLDTKHIAKLRGLD